MSDDDLGRIVSPEQLKKLERAVLTAVTDSRRHLDRYRAMVLFDDDPRRVSHAGHADPPLIQIIFKFRDAYLALDSNTTLDETIREQMKKDYLHRLQVSMEKLADHAVAISKVAKDVLVSIAALTQKAKQHQDHIAIEWAKLDQKGIRPMTDSELEKIAMGQPMRDADPIVIEDEHGPAEET